MNSDLFKNESPLKETLADSSQSNSNTAEGHRTRLLDRYVNNGLTALHEHEIVELLLTYAIPRKDTKAIARALLKKYKSISGIMNASIDELQLISGIGRRSAALFPFLRDLMGHCLKEKYQSQSLLSHRRDVEEYLRFFFGQRRDEYVAAIFLNTSNHVLETHILAEGTVNQCAIYPRTVIDKALRSGAASIILAHNHPGGTLNPSEADWAITERMHTIGKLMEIPLLDHIIISKQKVLSLREFPRWPK